MKKTNRAVALIIATILAMSLLVAGCGKKTEEADAGIKTESAESIVNENTAIVEQTVQSDTQDHATEEQSTAEVTQDDNGTDNSSSAISFEKVDKDGLNLENPFQS